MTVTALVTRNDITATASQTSFTYTFRVLAATDMDVYQNGVLLSSGYTVNDVGNTTGGTVTLDSGVPVGQIVSLVLAMPLDRTTNYQNSGKFLADDVNEDFDKIYIGAVQNENEGGRSLRLKDVEPPTVGVDMTIPLKADRLGKFLAFDSTTGGPIALDGSSLYDSAAWSAYDFTGDGSTVAFTLGSNPNAENNTQVYIDGVYQQKNGYSVSGAVLTFSVAPPDLSTIEVMVTTAMAVGSTSSDLVSYLPAGTGAVATTVQTKLRETVSVKDFGAVGDGVTDDSGAFNAASSAVEDLGGTLLVPSGTYLLSSQWGILAPSSKSRITIEGYGAEIITSGAISGIQVESGSGDVNTGVDINGLKVNHRGNSTATYGFEILGSWNTRLYNCTVEAHGTSATYAAFRVADGDAGKGSFWTKFNYCWARKRSGSDAGEIPVGILIQGNSNATTVNGCGLNNCDKAIHITDQGDIDSPNAVLIFDTAMEVCTDGVYVDATEPLGVSVGLRISNCRAEVLTTFLNYQLATESSQPPVLMGNVLVSSVSNYITNPNNLMYVSYDVSTTPRINPTLRQSGNFTLDVGDTSEQGLVLKQNSGAESGMKFALRNGTALMKIGYISSGDFVFAPNVSGGVRAHYNGVKGISNTATKAENLRAAVVLSGGTASVSFATAEPDASYFISLSGNANETFSWSTKTTSGFTITSSNGSSTATVDWILVR